MANHLSHVAAAAARWPDAWRQAHTHGAGTEDFIRLLASFLHHDVDPNVGLNGKRGNPNDISDDALAVFDPAGDVTDRTGRRMVIIDCIVGAGGPNPQPAWASVGGPSPGAWVQPARIHDQRRGIHLHQVARIARMCGRGDQIAVLAERHLDPPLRDGIGEQAQRDHRLDGRRPVPGPDLGPEGEDLVTAHSRGGADTGPGDVAVRRGGGEVPARHDRDLGTLRRRRGRL